MLDRESTNRVGKHAKSCQDRQSLDVHFGDMVLEIQAPVKVEAQPAYERSAADSVGDTIRHKDGDGWVTCEVGFLLCQVQKFTFAESEF